MTDMQEKFQTIMANMKVKLAQMNAVNGILFGFAKVTEQDIDECLFSIFNISEELMVCCEKLIEGKNRDGLKKEEEEIVNEKNSEQQKSAQDTTYSVHMRSTIL